MKIGDSKMKLRKSKLNDSIKASNMKRNGFTASVCVMVQQ